LLDAFYIQPEVLIPPDVDHPTAAEPGAAKRDPAHVLEELETRKEMRQEESWEGRAIA